MKDLIGQCLTVFMGLFAIMNPIANAPIFLSLTADDSPDIRRRIAGQALLLSFVLIVVFVLAGRLIFSLFGITLPAFQIVGGVLVALIGHHMLQGRQSPVQHLAEPHNTTPASSAALGIAVTPLAMPILAGPGTIATAMNFASTGHMREMLVTIAAFAVLCGVTYVAFLSGERLVRFLGPNGLSVVTRLMGLILAVIGVQMLITGIAGAVKANGG